MRSVPWGMNCRILLLAQILLRPAMPQPPPAHGVVVEQVEPGSSAEKAGLRTGDLIVSWFRRGARGEIDSPLDLAEVSIQQSPRGPLTLEGMSDAEKRAWLVSRETTGRPAQVLNPWGLDCRPVLPPDILTTYRHAAELAQTGAWAETAQNLERAANSIRESDSLNVGPWLLSQAGEVWAQAGRSKEAYDAYEEAIRRASDGRSKTILLLASGDLGRIRNDSSHAEDCYTRALAESRKLELSFAAASSLTALGVVANTKGDLAKAEEYYRQALTIRKDLLPDSLDVARSLNNLGWVRFLRGDPDQAEQCLHEALSIEEKLVPASFDLSIILLNLGMISERSEHTDLAEKYFRQALEIRERVAPATPIVAVVLDRLAILLNRQGDLAGAEEYIRRELAITRKAPESEEYALCLGTIAEIALRRGDLSAAEDYYNQALPINEKLAPDGLNVAAILSNIAAVVGERGDFAQAEALVLRALAIQQKRAPGNLNMASSLSLLGEIASEQGNSREAQEYFQQASAILQQQAPGSLLLATVLRTSGTAAAKAGDFRQAEDLLLRSLGIRQKMAPGTVDYAESLSNLGELETQRGNLAKAEDYYRQALEILETSAPGTQGEAETAFGLATALVRQGHGDRAIPFFEQGANSLDRQMGRLGGPDEVRSEFRAQFDSHYRDYVGLLLEQNQPQAAFAVLERSRARSLLDMLAERDLVFATDLPPAIQRERKLNAADYDRTQARLARLNPEKAAAQAAELAARLRELAAAREKITDRVKRASPRLAALEYPQPIELEAARRALDAGTVLLSYAVAEDRCWLFVIRPAGADPGLTVAALPVGSRQLRSQVDEYRKLMADRSPAGRSALNQRARALYDQLVKPAEAQIAASSRLLLIPDGPLHTLPFAALMRSDRRYLIEWKPLHTIVSATVYDQLRKSRGETHKPGLQLAAFGDPVYPKQAPGSAIRPAAERGLDLSQLPFSRDEVTGIAALYPGNSKVFLGAEATEEHAKLAAPQALYLHFATHAFLDERFPLNSGLALTIPERLAEGQENGLLQAWEIFEQVRLNADLVVLSACQTGLGKEIGGEGLIGLTRALQYAGARSIVASLWNVDDLKTSELMKELYQQLQNGKSKDEALRAAQLALLHSRTGSHPYYWAAFSLIGDWR